MLPSLPVLLTILSAGFILCLPGLALLAWTPKPAEDSLERLAQAIGLSIALTALFALLASSLAWRITAPILLALYLLAAILALAGLLKRGGLAPASIRAMGGVPAPPRPLEWPARLRTYFQITANWKTPTLLLAVLFLLAWRIFQVRDLLLPAWVDSVHHVLLIRIILENGGLPQTLDPYLPVPFYYHFAFHALAASYAFWTQLPAEQALLYLGQALNAAVAFAVYRLGMALWGDPRRAAAAGLLVGFVSHMPAYYVTWGRYTLLTGLVLLPLAMASALDIQRQGRTTARMLVLALLTGGILLSHYFAALLLALFLAILACQTFLQDYHAGRLFDRPQWASLVIAPAAGAALAAAWVFRIWEYSQGSIGLGAVLSVQALDRLYFPEYQAYLWRLLGPDRNYLLLFLAPLGLGFGLWRPGSRALALWALALFVASFPFGIRLAPFRPDHAVIVLFLPACLLVVEGLFSLAHLVQVWIPGIIRRMWEPGLPSIRAANLPSYALGLLLASLVAWGLWDTRTILHPATILADKADLQAIRWIAENTPADARFFINTTHWQDNSYRGVDGGWWIMPLTGRYTLLPPALYIMGERAYILEVVEYAQKASSIKECSPAFWEIVRSAQLSYVYIHAARGSLQPSGLQDCEDLSLSYAAQGIYIYRLGGQISGAHP